MGLGILAIGVWAWTEKDTFNNLSLLTNVALDPAFIFIWAGAITFLIGFTGFSLYVVFAHGFHFGNENPFSIVNLPSNRTEQFVREEVRDLFY